MYSRTFFILAFLFWAASVCCQTDAEGQSARAAELFAIKVKPLLAQKCFSCHGSNPEEIAADLDLTSRQGMLDGNRGASMILIPGDGSSSLLYKAVTWDNPELQMPEKESERLTEEQTWWIRDWIDGGAPWPDEQTIETLATRAADAKGVRVQTSGGQTEEWNARRYEPENLWAYQPLEKPGVPVSTGGPGSPIDAFIDRRLERMGVSPAPAANRLTLIRRLSFDLTGLPPTPVEVDSFINDPAPEDVAYGKVVDRLLASPHYGERWGQHWLDVVRYADSSGFSNDYARGNAWRYRDYVIRSFNEDKPYDQFVREQIAGDEIAPDNPEALIATGFLRMGPWELTAMEVPRVARQRFLDDVTDIVGQTFLSHPLQCARCHDHKFDPIPTRDYYRLQAVFATTQMAERVTPFLEEENTSGFEERKYLQERGAGYLKTLKRLDDKSLAAVQSWYADRNADASHFEEILQRIDTSRWDRYSTTRSKLRNAGVSDDDLPPRHLGYTPEDHGLERIARKGIQRLTWEMEQFEPYAIAVYNGTTPEQTSVSSPRRISAHPGETGVIESTAILQGGDPFSPTAAVSPGVLSAVAAFRGPLQEDLPETLRGRRTALADWITHPDNPLAARSMANRIWQGHFGRGIAGNPNNFGAMGKKPTHPELLDWLAATFIEREWSVKEMHRLILMSRTYRRASAHPDATRVAKRDPEGESYAVFRPRRLDAEELRDAMLRVSGELNLELGGIPVRPEINMEVALQPRQVMGAYAAAWQPSPTPAQRHRRSIYVLRLRGLGNPFMEVFNTPSQDIACEAREVSTVTPQVFTLFNGEQSYDRALAFADRLRRETNTQQDAIGRAFRLALNRPPSEHELAECLSHWSAMEARHASIVFEPKHYPREIVREAIDENTGEPFTFSESLNVYKDFIPDLKPSEADATTRGLAEVCLVLFNTNEFLYVY